MRDKFDRLEKGSIPITEYDLRFHALSRYSYASISIESKKIQKIIKGLNVSLQLPTNHMVVYGASF